MRGILRTQRTLLITPARVTTDTMFTLGERWSLCVVFEVVNKRSSQLACILWPLQIV
jgi:hypothetical protein